MIRFTTLFLVAMVALSCSSNGGNKTMYSSSKYQLNSNGVVQGDYHAVVKEDNSVESDYQTTAHLNYSRRIQFKFSINEQDNEAFAGGDHVVYINSEHESPIITFGQRFQSAPSNDKSSLPINYSYTFRVDFSAIFNSFESSGSYITPTGQVISKNDFKAVYICGGSYPLSWDFSNLDEKGLAMVREGESNIYSITLTLNPLDTNASRLKRWSLSRDISQKPSFKSDYPIVDALYKMSLEEALINIEADSTFRTGAKWGGVWTRDVSYSIFLAFAYHQPDVAMVSLRRKVKRGRIVQDTGSGGAWPVSSDRVVWALAANEIYKATGNREWLSYAFEVIKNSVEDDKMVVYDATTGLYKGESSFLDWREQTYPKWMDNADIYNSLNLGTNVLHYMALTICDEMAKELGVEAGDYSSRAQKLKESINTHLWMADRGFYAQYLYGRDSYIQSSRYEALGEALVVLFGVASSEQAVDVYRNSPLTEFGASCIYPQISGIPPYHNNAVWPFVQAYWNLGAAKAKNERVLTHGLASIYRAGALFLTNYENFVASNGDYYGTEINSDRMLWSMAGNIAMVHRVFMGIGFETGGIRFSPAVPEAFKGNKELTGFKYRNALLNIKVTGFGANIASFKLDGKELNEPFLSSNIEGTHQVEIVLDNKSFATEKINLVDNHFTLPTPQAQRNGTSLAWNSISGAKVYHLYHNGAKIATITDTIVAIIHTGNYMVTAVDTLNWSSFASEPIRFEGKNYMDVAIDKGTKTTLAANVTNYTGLGFAELSNTQNREFELTATVAEAGNYMLDVRYANGSGPWNTNNCCALRTLYINNNLAGTVVMPQRGDKEWSNWGYSNTVKVNLAKGTNRLKFAFMPWNENMNVDVNSALVDQIRLFPIE